MTELELDDMLKGLPTYWKKVGEKKMIENAYRYLMKHRELLQSEAGNKAHNYAGKRVAQIWCRETNTKDEAWMRSFIDRMFADQNQRTLGMAECGKQDAEFLIRVLGLYPGMAEKMLSTSKTKK